MWNKWTAGVGCLLALAVFVMRAVNGEWDIAWGWGVATMWAFTSYLKST